jgi:hypothetical protein
VERSVVPDIQDQSDSDSANGITRRTVTKAMAWAVPVIAVSASAPAFAASQAIFTLDGRGCKLPGASNDVLKGYALGVVATNPFDEAITVRIDFITLNGEDLGRIIVVDLSGCVVVGTGREFTIPANSTFDNLILMTQNAASSSQGTLAGKYSVIAGPGSGASEEAVVDVSPPVNGNSCRAFSRDERDCIQSIAPPDVNP